MAGKPNPASKRSQAKAAKAAKGKGVWGANPGERRGGREKGTPNKKTVLRNQMLLEASKGAGPDETPLQLMMRVMRMPAPANATVAEQIQWGGVVLDAANKAAPYVHARLAPIEGAGSLGSETAEEKAAQMRAKARAMREATQGGRK